MNDRRRSPVLIVARFTLMSMTLAMAGCVAGRSTGNSTEAYVVFDEVWSLVNEHFFDPDFNGVNWDSARRRYAEDARMDSGPAGRTAVIRDMLAELNTSHTAYYTRHDREYYDLLGIFADPLEEFIASRFAGEGVRYEGVGVITDRIDDRWHVVDILPGTPAARADVHVGDVIIDVNSEPYAPIDSFRGRVGEVVVLSTQRTPEADSRRSVAMRVQWLHPMQVYEWSIRNDSRLINHNGTSVAYVRIRNYASSAMQDALSFLVTNGGPLAGADALVLDIRGGWGGANPGYLDLFDDRIPKLTYQSRHDPPRIFDDRWRKPVVLLIDGGTRSGKEVLAFGFRKHSIGTLVGERTAGSVAAGRPFILSDGSLLFLAVADVLVDGTRLEGQGVEPDVKVEYDISYAAGADPPLQRAIEIAASDVAKSKEKDTPNDESSGTNAEQVSWAVPGRV